MLNRLVGSGDVSSYEEKEFYGGAKAFFLQAFEYSLNRIPIEDSLGHYKMPSLSILRTEKEETLGNIMTIKMEMANQPDPKGIYQFPPAILSEAKTATSPLKLAC